MTMSNTISTTTEETASYVLSWSLSFSEPADGEPRKLVLAYQMEAFEELYISDRLWDYGAGRQRIEDPFGIYRFVVDDTLRLVFGQAPHPANVVPNVTYTPLYSRVNTGETRKRTIHMALPVDEYSSLSRNIAAPTVVETVSRVQFVLGVRFRSDLDADPVPPPRETAAQAGYVVYGPKRIVSSCAVDGIEVNKRSEYMPRYALDGEPAAGPMPPLK